MHFKRILEQTYTFIIIAIFLLIFSFVTIKFFIPKTIVMVHDFPYPTEYYSSKKVLFVLLLTFLLFILFLIYYKLIVVHMNKTLLTITSVVFILIILASEIMISYIAFFPKIGDYGVIREGIEAFYQGKKHFPDMDQFQLYPYNTHILLIGGYFAKLIGNVALSMKILPIVTITGSIIFNSLILGKITNMKAAHISIVMSLLNILIYWQSPVFYTHTLVVFFLPGTLYAYLCLKTANTRGKKIVWWIVLGGFSACTYIIRPTALSVAAAIVLENIFRYRKEKSFKMLSSFLFCVLLIFAFNSTTKIFHLNTDNQVKKMPYSHWIKMGLNAQTYGVWNLPDVTYPANIKNTHQRDVYNRKIIEQRLKTLGPVGYMKHLNEKVERLWVSSQFSMYRVGQWFLQKNDSVANIVSNYKSTSYKVFDLYSFIIKLFILSGALAAVFQFRRLNENEAEVLRISMISIVSIFCFLLLWETAPHYSYEAYVLLNIPATIGFYQLFHWIGKNRRSVKNKG